MWTIYYADGSVVNGSTRQQWRNAPASGVQVVVLWEPPPLVEGVPFRPWSGVNDRQLWTGEDEYDPFGYGHPKRGKLIDRADYERISDRAFYGEKP